MSPLLLAISYFFHLVATVIWLGGLAMLLVLVFPEARKGEYGPLLMRIRKRFAPLTHFSLAVLVFTGLIQMPADPQYEGVLAFENDWSRAMLFKHIAILGMVVCGAILQYGITPALDRASLLAARGKGDPAEAERLTRQETRLTWASALLALLVLAFTAWATAL